MAMNPPQRQNIFRRIDNFARGQTRGMIGEYRRSGYLVNEEADSAGRRVWRVNYPHWRYNPNTDINDPSREYVGKIVDLPPSRSPRFLEFAIGPYGRPWFYVVGESPTNQTQVSNIGRDAIQVAQRVRPGSVRTELP